MISALDRDHSMRQERQATEQATEQHTMSTVQPLPTYHRRPAAAVPLPRGDGRPASMSFFAPVNERYVRRGARGVSTEAMSGSAWVAITVATTIVGIGVAFVVTLLHLLIESIGAQKHRTVSAVRASKGPAVAWALDAGVAYGLGMLAFGFVVAVPHARGSGLPQLIAYLNGVKLRKFTSFQVLCAKLVSTSFVVGGGYFCGPEGPIIHLGACVGKCLLRSLYKLGRFRGIFAHFRNDLDERDLVAIGAGAGVAAAFMAPISGTLFVVEEAASHFSLALLWRTFYAAIVAQWSSSFLRSWGDYILTHDGREPALGTHPFTLQFEQGTGTSCRPPELFVIWVVPLAALNGLLGAALNLAILRINRSRTKLYERLGALNAPTSPGPPPEPVVAQPKVYASRRPPPSGGFTPSADEGEEEAAAGGSAPSAAPPTAECRPCCVRRGRRRFILLGSAEVLVLALLSTGLPLLAVETANPRCRPRTLGSLYFGSMRHSGAEALENGGQCETPPLPNGSAWGALTPCIDNAGTVCMPQELRALIPWTHDPAYAPHRVVCDSACLEISLNGSNACLNMLNSYSCEAAGGAAAGGAAAGEAAAGGAAAGDFSDLGTLLLGSTEKAVKALFYRGLPGLLSPTALLLSVVCWSLLAALTAGAPLPCGLLMPMLIIGGSSGRLFGLFVHELYPLNADPGLFALFGATATLAGSGQIRLFLTMVMLEITDQLHLVPFVAVAAVVAVASASLLTGEGLYHALIEAAGLPYLPLERPPEYDTDGHGHAPHEAGSPSKHGGETTAWSWCRLRRPWREETRADAVLVRDVMSRPPLQTLRWDATRDEVSKYTRGGAAAEHSAFPVVAADGCLGAFLG